MDDFILERVKERVGMEEPPCAPDGTAIWNINENINNCANNNDGDGEINEEGLLKEMLRTYSTGLLSIALAM